MERSFLALAGLCLLVTSSISHADMYLVARGKLEGTDLTVVSFLRDKRMTDRATCEAERRAARTTGFRIFARVYVRTNRGFSSQLQTYCLESDQQLAPLPTGSGSSVSYTYLVEATDGRLKLTPFGSTGECTAVAGPGNQTSEKRYCARSQQLLKS